jgi:hypothetical protein
VEINAKPLRGKAAEKKMTIMIRIRDKQEAAFQIRIKTGHGGNKAVTFA